MQGNKFLEAFHGQADGGAGTRGRFGDAETSDPSKKSLQGLAHFARSRMRWRGTASHVDTTSAAAYLLQPQEFFSSQPITGYYRPHRSGRQAKNDCRSSEHLQ